MAKENPMREAVAYLRVSGKGQVRGDGFLRQFVACRAYAKANGIKIVRIYKEKGISGKTELEDRDALAECLREVQARQIGIVLVEGSDRLARDSIVSEVIIREFQKIGVHVIAASGGVDLTVGDDSNPTAKLIRQILAAIAEFDRCVTVLKLRGARQRIRARNGKCEGRKAFGELPGEEKILSLMIAWKASGLNRAEVADCLNREGHPSRRGGRWKPSTVAKILARETKST